MLPPFVQSMNARLFLLGRRRFLFIRKSPLEKRFLRGQIHSSQFLMLGSFGLVQRTNASRHSRHLFVSGRLSRLLDLPLSFRLFLRGFFLVRQALSFRKRSTIEPSIRRDRRSGAFLFVLVWGGISRRRSCRCRRCCCWRRGGCYHCRRSARRRRGGCCAKPCEPRSTSPSTSSFLIHSCDRLPYSRYR